MRWVIWQALLHRHCEQGMGMRWVYLALAVPEDTWGVQMALRRVTQRRTGMGMRWVS
jgi:hypothetical protein